MKHQVLVYGAYGYTGKLILDELLRQKICEPLLVGQNATKISALANQYTLDFEVAHVTGIENVLQKHKSILLLINAAGPFAETATTIAKACIKNGVHYIDITGEIEVFKDVLSLDEDAKKAGVMLMPGTGFDIAPTDCLANVLKIEMEDATHLEMAFAGIGGGVSRGTALTSLLVVESTTIIRKNGKLINMGWKEDVREINFGPFKKLCVPIPWGDLQTAFVSTAIPNIKVYIPLPIKVLKNIKALTKIIQFKPMRKLVAAYVKRKITGPSKEQRESSQTHIIGWVTNDKGKTKQKSLITPDGYTFTARCSANISRKILNGKFKTGYQTPAMAYGPYFIDEIKDVRWTTRTSSSEVLQKNPVVEP